MCAHLTIMWLYVTWHDYMWFLSKLLPHRDPNLFQHDSAPAHKRKSMQTWFAEYDMEELECLAQSPDLNHMECLWYELKLPLHAGSPHPTSVPDPTKDLVLNELQSQQPHSKMWWKSFLEKLLLILLYKDRTNCVLMQFEKAFTGPYV